MSGHRPWAQIRQRENTLYRLRHHEGVSQQELARALGVSQANISRIEHENDLRLSTIQRFVESLGGELIVQARIGDEIIDLLPTTSD